MQDFAVSKKCMTKDFSDFSFSPSGFLLFLFSCSCWLFSSSLTSICHHLHLHLSKLISPLPPLPGCSFSLSLAAILSSLTLVFLSWPILSLSLLSPCYLLSLSPWLLFYQALPLSFLAYTLFQAYLSSFFFAWQLSHISLPRSHSTSLLLLASLSFFYFSFSLCLAAISYILT